MLSHYLHQCPLPGVHELSSDTGHHFKSPLTRRTSSSSIGYKSSCWLDKEASTGMASRVDSVPRVALALTGLVMLPCTLMADSSKNTTEAVTAGQKRLLVRD